MKNTWTIVLKSKSNKTAKDRKLFVVGSFDAVNKKINELSKQGSYSYEVHCNSYALEK